MGQISLIVLVILTAAASAVLIGGALRWRMRTGVLLAELERGRQRPRGSSDRAAAIDRLPAPVQRYFRAVLSEGGPVISAVTMTHTGEFDSSGTGDRWRPFRSTQRVVTRRPGFVWDARIGVGPGVAVRVHDAYCAGEGILHASLFGLFAVADLRGPGAVAEGELMRFLAEAAWFPTALLPGQGVEWQAVDDRSARATLRDGDTTVSLLFRFTGDGLIDSVRAEARGRMLGRTIVPTPWEGRWSHYEWRQGVRVPLEGEVSWWLPEGRRPYWRGRLTQVEYEFDR